MPKFDTSQDSLQPEPAARIFIGRERQIADFRASVSYLLKKANKPTGDFYPHLFIAYGEGGMGKSRLLDRWLEVAREEGFPPERIIAIDLDYNIYPSPRDLADKMIDGLCDSFPDFDRGYRDVRARRQALKSRHDELREQWERWQAHVENGTADELVRTWSKNLARTELKKAEFGGDMHAPTMLSNEADGARRELQALRGFLDANGRGPQSLGELLERELGEEAALFDPATSAKALGNDIYEQAEQRPLVLALDTYELADRHHNWLLELYFEVGDQVLLLIGGRNAIHKGDYHERRFSGKLRPLVQAYDLGNETFSGDEIRKFVAQTLGGDPDDADVARIERISRGVPLAVEALAGELKDNGDLRMYAGLDTRSAARNEIIRKVLNRFMRYTIADRQRDSAEDTARKQADRAAIRGLALLLRPDPELICALWDCDDQTVEDRIGDLGGRHSFVFARAGSFELHDLVRQFIREDLWYTKTKQFEWARLRKGLRCCLGVIESRLARYLTTPYKESYDTAAFREAVLDRFNLLLWLDELDEAKRWLLNRWLEARHYYRRLANELEKLLHELTPRQSSWRKLHELIVSEAIRNPRPNKGDDENDPLLSYSFKHVLKQRNFAALKSFTGLLNPHAHMLYHYLWADQDEVFGVSDEDDLQTVTRNIALLEQSFHLDPAFTPSTKMLAKALSRRGRYYAWEGKDYAQAVADLDRALEIDPEDSFAYFNRASAKHVLGDHEAAIADYDRAIALNPNDAEDFNNRGLAKAKLRDYAAAITDYDRAIKIKPDYADAFINRGLAKANLEDYAAAILDYDRAIEIKPDDADAFANRGSAKANLGNYTAAIADYDRAITIKSDDIEVWMLRSFAKAELGDYDAALADTDYLIKLNPNLIDAWLLYGAIKAHMGDLNAAMDYLNHTIELNPNSADAFNARGYIKIKAGDFVGARADIERAIEIDPADFNAVCSMAELHIALGEFDAAFEWMERAIAVDPTVRKIMCDSEDYDPIRADPRFRALVGE